MEVTRVPPLDAAAAARAALDPRVRPDGPSAANPAARPPVPPDAPGAPGAALGAELGSGPAALAGLADRVDIGPLDLAAALQILVTEVRVELGLPAASLQDAGLVPPQTSATPTQAAQQLLHLLVRALPADDAPHDPVQLRAWAAATIRVQAALQFAMDRAVDAVTAWREVPAAVVDAARETRTLVVSLLSDEPPSPLWFRPEWLELAPRIQRHWRRRRRARRAFSDPDPRRLGPHDADEPSS